MKIIAPTKCPSCNTTLTIENNLLYCRSVQCKDQKYKTIENFAKAMKILGLGPASIKKLNFTDITELYTNEKSYFIEKLGSALGEKLFNNIQKSKNASLNRIIASMGIPLIGKTAADKICLKVSNIYEITDDIIIETLGPKAAENFLQWLHSNTWVDLPFQFVSEKPVEGKSVCITGKLKSFKNKSEAAVFLKERGYTVASSVTKSTDILVNESGLESEKTKKARANGTQIITNIMELK